MCIRLLFVWLVVAVTCASDRLYAQFTDPHNYDDSPVGLNELEFAFAYAQSNASIDTAIVIAGAKLDLYQGSFSYSRYFGLAHRLFWVTGNLPAGRLNGSISGTRVQGSVAGMGDSACQIGGLLKGGPALSVEQFASYKPTTIVGLSLIITVPTGLYDSGKVLNLGSDRWSFKPEIALTHPFGAEQKWQVDTYANVYFFTDNTSYRRGEVLRQDPLPGIEGHLSYSFLNNLWASFDARYSFRGATSLNGVSQDNAQRNFSLGSEVSFSLNARNTFTFVYDKAVVHENGPALAGFSLKYAYTWGKGYR